MINRPTYSKATEARLTQLVTDMEAEGYRIGMAPEGSGYYIKPAPGPLPDVCSMARFNLAPQADPALAEAVEPFLEKHRPASVWAA